MAESDFERIDLDPVTEEVRYQEKPDYAQAIFHNIAEVYPTDAHIVCDYNITSALIVSHKDFIGLFKVGWKPSDDPVCYQRSPMPSMYKPGDEFNNRVVFQAPYLPKDDGEFYQFCYVSGKRSVRGASTPFQFRKPTTDDYVEIEEDDLMMVKTRTSALMEDLNKALTEKSKMEKQLRLVEKDRDEHLNNMMQFKNGMERAQKQGEQLTEQLGVAHERFSQLEKERDSTVSICDSLKEKLDTLTKEKSRMEKKIEEKDDYISSLQEKIKALISEKDALTGKNKTLEQEKELFKNHFTSTESNMQRYMKTIEEQRSKLEEQDKGTLQLRDEVQRLRCTLQEEQCKVEAVQLVKASDQMQLAEMAECLRHAEDKLSANDAMVAMMKSETLAQKQVITKMSSDLEETKSESYNLHTRYSQLEKEHKDEKTKWLDKKAALEALEKEAKKEAAWLQSWYAQQLKEHQEEKAKWSEEKAVMEAREKESAEEEKELQAYLTQQVKEQKAEKTKWLDEKAELQAVLKGHEKELSQLAQKVEDLSQQAEAAECRTEEEQGSLYALQKAQAHLRERYSKMKTEYTEMKKENEALLKRVAHHQQMESDLRREVVDLKERLFMGAEEYKTKYLEARKLESDIRRLTKQLKRSLVVPKGPSAEVAVETDHAQGASSGTQTPTSSISVATTSSSTSRVSTADVGTFSRVATSDVGTVTRQQMSDAGTSTTKWPEWSGSEESFEMTEYEEIEGLAVAMPPTAPTPTTPPPPATPPMADQEKVVEELTTEIALRKAKQQKYKQLYHDEKQKIAVLQKYYYGEVERKDEEMAEVIRQHEEKVRSLWERVDAQKQIIERQRMHIEQLSSEQQGFVECPVQVPSLATPRPRTPQSYPSPVQMPSPSQTLPHPSFFPQAPLAINQNSPLPTYHPSSVPLPPYPAVITYPAQTLPPSGPVTSYPAHFNPFSPAYNQSPNQPAPPLRYGNPYESPLSVHVRYPQQEPKYRDLSAHDPHGLDLGQQQAASAAAAAAAREEDENNNQCCASRNPPRSSSRPVTPPSTSSSLQVDAGAAAAAPAAAAISSEMENDLPPVMETPLTPLPAPIQPTILPVAKMAAVKCLNQRGARHEGLNMFLEDSLSDDDEGPPPLEFADAEEERFHDADGEPQKLCPACNMTFPADFPQHVFEAHVDGHYGPVCPMCHEQFEVGMNQHAFEAHVQLHFDAVE